ncbi:MAG TPA: transposase [Phototrophicaceae bacterium]|nr:transposase [Phototrophicaceae bacterium]
MKLIVQVKLQPTPEQRQYLLQTLEQANALCDQISAYAWEHKTFRSFALHQALYHALRASSDLSAQVVVRLFAKVADAYKKDKKTQRHFRPHGAIAYDDRILTWYTDQQHVSIWSVGGRLNIAYLCGQRQRELLAYRKGESDLVYSKSKEAFYLLAVCDIPDPTEQETDAALGVDLGRTNIAVDSDGEMFSSDVIEVNRHQHAQLRRRLQKRGSKSAKRHLKQLSGKQRRFQRDVNHCISKRLVQKAERTGRSIRLEDLKGINRRTRVKGKEERARQHNWSFHQLRLFVSYKARLYGVKVEYVDPRYTSQRCFACGHIAKENRRSQSEFLCAACGHTAHADVNAALNIACWASVNAPIVSDAPAINAAVTEAAGVAPGTSQSL